MKRNIRILLIVFLHFNTFCLLAQDFRDSITGYYEGKAREVYNSGDSTEWFNYALWVQKSPHDTIGVFATTLFRTAEQLNKIDSSKFLRLDSNYQYTDGVSNGYYQSGFFYEKDSMYNQFLIVGGGNGQGAGRHYFYGKRAPTNSIVQNVSNVIHISPNPTSAVINLSGTVVPECYQLYSLSGRLVQSGKVENKSISVADLPKGVYLLSLEIKGSSVMKRVMKE